MEKHQKIAALYIATLKAISFIHTHNHWLTRGAPFYGNHLLFERIYNSALENLDLAAEKFVGLFGDPVLDYDLQVDLLHKVLSKYSNLEGSPLEMSLSIEKDFLKLSQQAYKLFDEEGEEVLTLGLDDALCAIADKREEAVYLLQQALKGNTK
jgi:DNA-binding ferritin-like protein